MNKEDLEIKMTLKELIREGLEGYGVKAKQTAPRTLSIDMRGLYADAKRPLFTSSEMAQEFGLKLVRIPQTGEDLFTVEYWAYFSTPPPLNAYQPEGLDFISYPNPMAKRSNSPARVTETKPVPLPDEQACPPPAKTSTLMMPRFFDQFLIMLITLALVYVWHLYFV